MLDIFLGKNNWFPPEISEEEMEKMAVSVSMDINARQSDEYLYIFQVRPYIDSIYIRYGEDRKPLELNRFTIHEGYVWNAAEEQFFHDHCIKSGRCSCSGGKLDEVYEWSKNEHPEWHTKRYLTKGLCLLDHIYHCCRQETSKEMLYKAGLDELAVNIDELDEINLLASKPSELYDGLPMKVLRSLNCEYGAKLIGSHERRLFLKELNYKFPLLFKEKLNDAQCRYINTLIKGDLSIDETGRLFESRRGDLAKIWAMSMFEIFIANEYEIAEIKRLCEIYSKMDDIYNKYIKEADNPYEDYDIKQLEYYLILHRDEYDKAIRRANRRREYV